MGKGQSKLRAALAMTLTLVLSTTSFAHEGVNYSAENCFPKNDQWIPSFIEGQGVTKEEFLEVIDRVSKIYAPIIADLGGELVVKKLWDNATVNASANRLNNQYILNMYGGLARHRIMTKDGFAMVMCHELGHHLGGAPKIGTRWATNEGQSDYFAGLKCLRKVFATENSVAIVKEMESVDPVAEKECTESFKTDEEVAICIRSSMAGYVGAMLFKDLRKEQKSPKFDTPDTSKVEKTYHGHPATQCRMDTYFAGAICPADLSIDVSEKDPNVGVCARKFGATRGTRPLCWYSEENFQGAVLKLVSN